jgi:hypothetical protein
MQQSIVSPLERFGHIVDSRWRRYRCVVYLQRYQTYRSWLKAQNHRIPDDQPLVVFDFADNRIDGPQGRRFYTLFMFFVRAGFYPVLKENYLFMANIQERHKQFCLAEAFSVSKDCSAINRPYVLVTDKRNTELNWRQASKIIRIDYRPDYQVTDATIPMPFPMFSAVYTNKQDLLLNQYRQIERQWRVLFGGDAETLKYNKSSIRDTYQKLSRAQVLALLREQLARDEWCEPASQQELNEVLEQRLNGLLIVNTRRCEIPVKNWLATVAKASFFLACPGVRYPMSHNLIEALAVGSVPITQYPELFFPALEDGKNCLVYRGETDLTTVVNKAMAMDVEQIRQLSAGAVAYYEAYLDPVITVNKLLDEPQQSVALRLLPFLKTGGGYA